MKTRITLLIFSFLQTICLASYYDDYVGKIVPQTPQTAQLLKYGNYPVSHSSGLVQIEIPLYTIEYDGVTVPISISYHASGIKVDELASVVGLGWTLNAGGVIGRNIMGSSDHWDGLAKWHNNGKRFYYSTAEEANVSISKLYSCDIHEKEGCWLADVICDTISGMYGNDNYDSQSDRYYYRFGDKQGTFRYEVSQDTIVLLPYKPISIAMGKYGKKYGFRVTDENGVIYFFEKEEVSSSTVETICEERKHSNQYISETTGWYLTSIITPTQKDTIRFEYCPDWDRGTITHVSRLYHEGNSWIAEVVNPGQRSFSDWLNNENFYPTDENADREWKRSYSHCMDYINQHNSFLSPVIQKITWSGNSVEFHYDMDRPENRGKLGKMFTLRRLQEIVVRNSSGETLKKASFKNDILGRTECNQRLLLSELIVNEDNDAEKYSFDYNKRELPDYNNYYRCTSDYWGYYNGNNTEEFIPDFLFRMDRKNYLHGADREPQESSTKAGILTSVTYPTGGKTEFVYEQNKDGNEYVGGLRIKEILNYKREKIEKREEYDYSCSDYSRPMRLYELFGYRTVYCYQSRIKQLGNWILDSKTELQDCYSSEPNSPTSALFGNNIFYKKVSKKVYDGNNNLVAFTEYEYEPDHELIPREDIPGSPTADIEPRFYSEEKNYDYGTVTPLLISQKDYKYDNGQRILERSIENRYETVRLETEPIVGVAFHSDYTAIVYAAPSVSHSWHPFRTPADFADNIFAFNVYGVPHYKRLVSTTEEENGLRTQTTYTYDSGFTTLRPLSVKTSRPECSDVEKRYTYAFQSDDPVLKSMTRDNYVDLIVGERVLEGGVVSAKSGDIYKMENGRYLLAEKQYAVGNNPLETRLKMANHDTQGNVTEIVRDGDSHVFLVWGYNYQYPIMKIECPVGKDADCREYLRNKVEAIGASIVPDEKSVKEIRDYMEGKGSLVVTYQYKPLVGLTEVTDEKGIRTFYKYDNQNRLSAIYDADGRMIESYKYNYKK